MSAPPRQALLLSLLDALGGQVSNLDFQKLLFLYCQDQPAAAYEFVPYRFGAFSFSSYADRRKLAERGLIASTDEGGWTLTDQGRAVARAKVQAHGDVEAFARQHAALRGDALVAVTYRGFPYFATRSEIAGRVLSQDNTALEAIEAARPEKRTGLCTIGYQGLSLEAYLNRLLRAGVTVLCDVRRNPSSRKYGFSKKTLEHACLGVGIRYEHVPELGIASSERRDLVSEADYERLFSRYEQETIPKETAALSRIAGWVTSGDHVALTCFEHRPNECHRLRVAWAVNDALRGHPPAVHL